MAQHSIKNTCETCRYAMPNNESSVVCRRYPPEITKVDGVNITCYFPILSLAAWCGEWKLRIKPS